MIVLGLARTAHRYQVDPRPAVPDVPPEATLFDDASGDTGVLPRMDRFARDLDDLRPRLLELIARGVGVHPVEERVTSAGEDSAPACPVRSGTGAFAERATRSRARHQPRGARPGPACRLGKGKCPEGAGVVIPSAEVSAGGTPARSRTGRVSRDAP